MTPSINPTGPIEPAEIIPDKVSTGGQRPKIPSLWTITLATFGAAALSACEPQTIDTSTAADTSARAEPAEQSEYQRIHDCLAGTTKTTYQTIGSAEDTTIIVPFKVLTEQESNGGLGCTDVTANDYWKFLQAHTYSPEDAALLGAESTYLVTYKDIGSKLIATPEVSIKRGWVDCDAQAALSCGAVDAFAERTNTKIETKLLSAIPDKGVAHTVCYYADKDGEHVIDGGIISPFVSLPETFEISDGAHAFYYESEFSNLGSIVWKIGTDLKPILGENRQALTIFSNTDSPSTLSTFANGVLPNGLWQSYQGKLGTQFCIVENPTDQKCSVQYYWKDGKLWRY